MAISDKNATRLNKTLIHLIPLTHRPIFADIFGSLFVSAAVCLHLLEHEVDAGSDSLKGQRPWSFQRSLIGSPASPLRS